MRLYSIRVRGTTSERQELRGRLGRVRAELARTYGPADAGASLRTGTVDLWVTVPAEEDASASDTARKAVRAAVANAGKGEDWLTIERTDATPVMVVDGRPEPL